MTFYRFNPAGSRRVPYYSYYNPQLVTVVPTFQHPFAGYQAQSRFQQEALYSAVAEQQRSDGGTSLQLKDYGPDPLIINIEAAAKQNPNYRTALWTGQHFQVTLMSIPVGGDIGLEVHPYTDQFIRVEEGEGVAQMGDSKENLDFEKKVSAGDAILVPAGKWHNLTNTGSQPLKLYVIYAPPQHPFGTVHRTKAEAEAAEK